MFGARVESLVRLGRRQVHWAIPAFANKISRPNNVGIKSHSNLPINGPHSRHTMGPILCDEIAGVTSAQKVEAGTLAAESLAFELGGPFKVLHDIVCREHAQIDVELGSSKDQAGLEIRNRLKGRHGPLELCLASSASHSCDCKHDVFLARQPASLGVIVAGSLDILLEDWFFVAAAPVSTRISSSANRCRATAGGREGRFFLCLDALRSTARLCTRFSLGASLGACRYKRRPRPRECSRMATDRIRPLRTTLRRTARLFPKGQKSLANASYGLKLGLVAVISASHMSATSFAGSIAAPYSLRYTLDGQLMNKKITRRAYLERCRSKSRNRCRLGILAGRCDRCSWWNSTEKACLRNNRASRGPSEPF